MIYENIILEVKEKIAIITLNRPKALNALNRRMMLELEDFFTRGGLEIEGLKGVIITGTGDKAFAAGADISEFLELGDNGGMQLSARGHQTFAAIERFHRPVIAAVNGYALGGGCELAMACHLRIAIFKAKFGQPEANLGLIPGYGGTQRLIQLIGKSKALELLMTTDMVDADDAMAYGLVNNVVSKDHLIPKCQELVEKIASKAPIAIQKIIETTNAYFDDNVNGFSFEIEAFGECSKTADFQEGASAFLEKRKADFKGK